MDNNNINSEQQQQQHLFKIPYDIPLISSSGIPLHSSHSSRSSSSLSSGKNAKRIFNNIQGQSNNGQATNYYSSSSSCSSSNISSPPSTPTTMKCSSSSINNILNTNDVDNDNQSKLCPSCSKVLLSRLLPLRDDLLDLFQIADKQVLNSYLLSAATTVNNNNNQIKPNEKMLMKMSNLHNDNMDDEMTSSSLSSSEIDIHKNKLTSKKRSQQVNDESSFQMNKISSTSNNLTEVLLTNEQTDEYSNCHSNKPTKKVENFSEASMIDQQYCFEKSGQEELCKIISKQEPKILAQNNENNENKQQQEEKNISPTSLMMEKIHKNSIQETNSRSKWRASSSHMNNWLSLQDNYDALKDDISCFLKNKDHVPKDSLETSTPSSPSSSPYAYVTIVWSNQSAINAILLANSIHFYGNHYLDGNNGQQIRIDLVAFIHPNTDTSIDGELGQHISTFYDRKIELKTDNLVLLNDETLGIQYIKVHLWKELATYHYKKCLYLESDTLVCGKISNLLLDCNELSACVDCFLSDYFNCSVFVFEPNVFTYQQLINYGIKHRLMNENSNESIITDDDKSNIQDECSEAILDEMSLLNKFFKNKWNKLSFIYNYVRNQYTYTQIPAFLKFGGQIRIVNFGGTFSARPTSHLHKNTASSTIDGPWNYRFNLNEITTTNKESMNQFKSDPIDDFSKYYLLLFVRRLWPLLSKRLIPLMLTQTNHQHDQQHWSVQDIVQIINKQSSSTTTFHNFGSFTLQRRRHSLMTNQNHNQGSLSTISNYKFEEPQTAINNDGVNEHQQHHTQQEKLDLQPILLDTKNNHHNQQQHHEQTDWERDHIDWMHQHQSDLIINRLKMKFKQ